jgi:hypothetical protein
MAGGGAGYGRLSGGSPLLVSGGVGGGGSTNVSGLANTGGGGGADGGGGGSGVVILRWSKNFRDCASTTGSPQIIASNDYYIYRFTGNGSITF